MTTRTLLLIVGLALLGAGTWLILATSTNTVEPSPVTVLNYDPPGLPYTLIPLRSGPRGDSARVGFLNPGAITNAIGRDTAGGWLLLDDPNGWISVSAGEIAGDIDSLPITDLVVAPPKTPLVSAVAPEDGPAAEMRLGPADSFSVIGTLEPEEPAVAVARDPTGEWLLIEPAGWVAIRDVKASGDIEGLPAIRIDF